MNNKSPKEKNDKLNGQSRQQGGFCLLYRDVKEGMVSLEQLDDPSIDQIYIMHPQYAEYSH